MSNGEAIGARVAQLLERSPTTPEDFLDQLGLETSITLPDVLNGSYALTPSDIVAAADILQAPIPVLTGDVPLAGHLGVSLRLGLVGDRSAIPSEALSYADKMLACHAVLNDLLGPIADVPNVPMSTDRYGINAGRASADRVRRVCSLGQRPVADLVGLVESFGYPVLFRRLTDGLHGINVRDERGGHPMRMIVVSTHGGWPMQRYTLAHELCHALYDDTGQVIFDHLEEPEAFTEVRAEAFARELLLPRQALVSELNQRRVSLSSNAETWARVAPELMLRWGVSRRALVRSLIMDGHVNDDTLSIIHNSAVRDLIEGAGLSDQWALMCDREHQESGSPMLVARAFEAFGQGLVSVRFVADVLNQNQAKTERVLVESGWLDPVRS